MVGPVTAGLNVGYIVPFLQDGHIAALPQQVNHHVNILDELAHDPQTGDVLHILLQPVLLDMPANHLFLDAIDGLDPPGDKFDWRMFTLFLILLAHPRSFTFNSLTAC